MLFDDRLVTVLRSPAQSEAAARTQFRQLLDLLGSMPADTSGELLAQAYERLDQLAELLPPTVQSAILRAPGLRLRNPALVSRLAVAEPQAAAAAMAMARLNESEWLQLIPQLPITARGFLRHRRDLPYSARQVLERLGVRDLVLPEPEPRLEAAPAAAPEPPRDAPEQPLPADAEAGIGALVRRIEAFQRARRDAAAAPRLPLGDVGETAPEPRRQAFDFATDPLGTVTWADPAMAPLVVGLRLGPAREGALAALDPEGAAAMARQLPVRGALLRLDGPSEIAGAWRIDAAPFFEPDTGRFEGYCGRLRRPPARPARGRISAPRVADRMRQLIHELCTPVVAIQGFAELIQQQMFGPAPNEYRALAAAVAVDAARLLAGFDEIGRLTGLESGELRLEDGQSDFRAALARIQQRLEGVLRPRSARIDLAVEGSDFLVALAEPDALQIAWRLLATLGGALAPGETIGLTLTSDGHAIGLDAELPASLADEADLFAAIAPPQPRAVSAGMFGCGFTLRLARAEATAAGGTLRQTGELLRLTLPVLTAPGARHTVAGRESGGASAA